LRSGQAGPPARAGLKARTYAWLPLAIAATLSLSAQTPPAPFDLLIVNARIIDGTGTPARASDIGIRNGRIVSVGQLASSPATSKIDAGGQVVAPGFIDVHTHADDIASHPLAENFAQMGVTTIVAGNCGSSALDIGDELNEIRNRGVSINFATLIGHNTVRQAVMGSADRAPTIDEIGKMKSLVFEAMANGAVGFSTGLQYIPGTYAKTNEITELMRVAANEGGIYATHMRNEGTALEDAIRESIRVAELTNSRLEISHLKVDSPKRWGASNIALNLIDDARKRGVDVQADQYAYTAGSSSLSIRFPSWALEGGRSDVAKRLNDPAMWSKIKAEMQSLLEERGFHDLSWAAIASYRADPSLNGLTMKAVAEKLKGSGTVDAQLEAAREIQLGGGASMVYHFMSDSDVAAIMRSPIVAIASDAGINTLGEGVPHPRGYGDNARVLGKYVRDDKVISLEEAVRKMTSLPAKHFGFADRGVIRPGAFADLVIFDPATVAERATYASPHAYPSGISLVIVNGVVTVKAGKHTGAKAGQVVTLKK
jgi:N-acyl-D-amino-acid deacylase